MIEAHGLAKRFGATVALDGIDLEVPAGAILGVLGPNGAGKTTAVRILTTLSVPDAGSARVAGHDVVAEAAAVQRNIGVTAQDATLDEVLTGRENLVMIGRLSGLRRAEARARASELLEQFDLSDAADRVLKEYSGGMRRRLDLAAGLVTRPPVLFLDEPTTGLDPTSRVRMWDVIRGARRRRRDAAADDPVPRRGRRARRPDRRHRPRARDRRRHRGRAEGADWRRAPGADAQRRPRSELRRGLRRLGPFVAGPVHVEPRRAAPAGARAQRRRDWRPRSCAPSTKRASASTTSRSISPRSTTCSSPSPASPSEAVEAASTSEQLDSDLEVARS